jgi:DNA-binding LytR/AlgR family response regulator
MNITALIIEDEPLAVDVIQAHCQRTPGLEVLKVCNDGFQALDAIQELKPQLIFLDINMPGLTGLELLSSLSNPPEVIFTTAYPEFAVQGYDFNICDYLLKPIPYDRFLKAVNKAKEHLKTKQTDGKSDDFIFVKSDKKYFKVKFNDIFYIEGLKDYVIIKTPTSRIVSLQTMKYLEERLPKHLFIRIHRSYIVNIEKIISLDNYELQIDTTSLPIGKNYKDELIQNIENQKL